MVSPWYCDTHVLVLSYAALWSPKRYPALGSVEPRCDLVRSSSAVPYCRCSLGLASRTSDWADTCHCDSEPLSVSPWYRSSSSTTTTSTHSHRAAASRTAGTLLILCPPLGVVSLARPPGWCRIVSRASRPGWWDPVSPGSQNHSGSRYCRKLTLYTVTKLRRGYQIRSQCSNNSAGAPLNTVRASPGSPDVGT
eukprot:1777911-Rhodomonas_salina.1